MRHFCSWVSGWCGLVAMVLWVGVAVAEDSSDPFSYDTAVALQSSGQHATYKILSKNVQATLVVSAGLRFDQLDWSIAGNSAGTNPNVLSELEWSQIYSYQVALSGRALLGRHLYGRGQVNYAFIQSGEFRDSDYAGNNKTLEYSRSISQTNDDQLWDIVAGVGYPLVVLQERLVLAPFMGYAIHKQNLRITNGLQVLSQDASRAPSLGPLDARLNSTYRAQWRGPLIGCDLRYRLKSAPNQPAPMELGIGLAYHFLTDFSAEALWNLRGLRFEQEADGHGFTVTADWLIRFSRYFSGGLTLNYTRFSTDSGVDTFYHADGRVAKTCLNPVSWNTYSVMIGLAYHFL